MLFDDRVNALWQNPHAVDLASPFLYFVSIIDQNGFEYRYIGKARNKRRLQEYCRNMRRIRAGVERGAKQGYRAVHLALFTALREGWQVEAIALENCDTEELNELERLRTLERRCNLNNAKTWRIAELEGLQIRQLLRDKTVAPELAHSLPSNGERHEEEH